MQRWKQARKKTFKKGLKREKRSNKKKGNCSALFTRTVRSEYL
jgi:hypothetical protein